MLKLFSFIHSNLSLNAILKGRMPKMEGNKKIILINKNARTKTEKIVKYCVLL